MYQNAQKYYQKIKPVNYTGLIYLFALLIFLSFYKKIIALFSSPSDKILDDKITTIDNISVGDNATISTGKASILADQIYNALDRFNDDEDMVYNAFSQIHNEDDMKLVFKAFGVRSYLLGTGANYLGTKMNLVEWLNNDLSSSELSKIQNKLNWI